LPKRTYRIVKAAFALSNAAQIMLIADLIINHLTQMLRNHCHLLSRLLFCLAVLVGGCAALLKRFVPLVFCYHNLFKWYI